MESKRPVDKLTSDTISLLRFPLCIAVVFIHTHMIGKDGLDHMLNPAFPFYSNFSYLISEVIASIAVPLFFLFSGYLFFNTGKSFSLDSYTGKLKKRAKSLLVPYLIWNLITLIFYAAVLKVKPDLFSGPRLISDYDLPNFLMAFWNAGDIGNPVCGPLWFIRDLMIVMLCSPLIFLAVKYLKKGFLLLFTIVYLFAFWKSVPGISSLAFYYFYLGAYISINQHALIPQNKNVIRIIWGIFIISAGYILYLKEDRSDFAHYLNILSGVFCMIHLGATLVRRKQATIPTVLTSGTFFIFASHYFPIIALCKISMKVFAPTSSWGLTIAYLLCPLVITSLCMGIFMLLCQYTPSLASLLSGGRIKK